MLHGIEIVFQNTQEIKDLLKGCHGYQNTYSKTVISMIFYFNYEFYLDSMNECISRLESNKIPYLKIEF